MAQSEPISLLWHSNSLITKLTPLDYFSVATKPASSKISALNHKIFKIIVSENMWTKWCVLVSTAVEFPRHFELSNFSLLIRYLICYHVWFPQVDALFLKLKRNMANLEEKLANERLRCSAVSFIQPLCLSYNV